MKILYSYKFNLIEITCQILTCVKKKYRFFKCRQHFIINNVIIYIITGVVSQITSILMVVKMIVGTKFEPHS